MNLSDVSALKDEMRHAFATSSAFLDAVKRIFPVDLSGLGFAFGARLTLTEGVYGFAIRVPSRKAWFQLLRPVVKRVLRRIPRSELDVQVIGPVRFNTAGALALAHANPALRIGAQVQHEEGATGTLGFFAEKEGRLGVVSCNHVLARLDRGEHGDRVIGPSGVELTLDGGYPRLRDATVPVKLADCAFAAFVNGDVPQNPAALDDGERLQRTAVLPTQELRVKKIGSATGVTSGQVVVRNLDGLPLPIGGNATALFHDVIEIHSDNGRRRFSRDGDSGALVYSSDDLRPVGLLFANTANGAAFNRGRSFANLFEHVVGDQGLDVRLVV